MPPPERRTSSLGLVPKVDDKHPPSRPVLRHLEKIDKPRKARCPRQLGRDISQSHLENPGHDDLTGRQCISAADLDVGSLPQANGGRDLPSTNWISERSEKLHASLRRALAHLERLENTIASLRISPWGARQHESVTTPRVLHPSTQPRIFAVRLALQSEPMSGVRASGDPDYELNDHSGRLPARCVGMPHRRNEPMAGGSDEGGGDKRPRSRFRDVSLHVADSVRSVPTCR
jgi:hypothetical protein